VETPVVSHIPAIRSRQGARILAITALGPLTTFAGFVWALVQPYRITLLDPDKHSFWYLAVQPPLLVMLVGALFHFWVVPGLLSDLEEAEERAT